MDIKLGEIIWGEAEKDAVHIAVAPVGANQRLMPGEHVGFVDSARQLVGKGNMVQTLIGVVDPFLKGPVHRGELFWLFLYPKSVTGMRHEWEHPLFTKDMEPSKKWMMEYAMELNMGDYEGYTGISWEKLLEAGKDYLNKGNYLVTNNSSFASEWKDEYWDHFQVLTGILVPEGMRENFFSCSC